MSRLLAPARIIMPSRVRLTTQYSASATGMHATDANTRYQGYDIRSPSAKPPASQGGVGTPCTSLPTSRLRASSKTRINAYVISTCCRCSRWYR